MILQSRQQTQKAKVKPLAERECYIGTVLHASVQIVQNEKKDFFVSLRLRARNGSAMTGWFCTVCVQNEGKWCPKWFGCRAVRAGRKVQNTSRRARALHRKGSASQCPNCPKWGSPHLRELKARKGAKLKVKSEKSKKQFCSMTLQSVGVDVQNLKNVTCEW